jgi:hypothetical protein
MFDIKRYISETYNTSRIADVHDNNDFYDFAAYKDSRIITFELKERTETYYDILVEAIQKVKKSKDELFDGLGSTPSGHELHIAVGWFYKTNCDRLIYVNPKFVYDIEWQKFKQLVWDKKDNLETKYSDLTTGTWNWVVPVSIIPKEIYIQRSNIWQITV